MSRFLLAVACGLALTAAPAFAKDPVQRADQLVEFSNPPEVLFPVMLDALHKQKVDIDGSKIGDRPLHEVLQALSTKHNVVFVVLEEEFKAQKLGDLKDQKSRVKHLDTKDMTLAEFLDVWLPGARATYRVHPDYVAVVPLLAKAPEPTPTVKRRGAHADAKDEPKPAPKQKADPAERILDALTQEFALKEGANVNEIPLGELLQDISKRHQIPFVINDESFKAANQPNIKDERPRSTALAVGAVTVHQFLAQTLESLNATYLVRSGAVEIVSVPYAAKVTKSGTAVDDDSRTRLNEPLVSVIAKEKPFHEVVAKVAEMYDLTVVVAPQAGDAKTGFVNVRVLNLPADKALELLALQADLRVVRRGTAFLVTSRDHAHELFNERLERERQKIELEKLREAPARPPAPEAPPAPPPAAKN